MKLQILIPQYKETEEVIKPMLDSLVVQQNIDFSDLGVIIVNDCSDVLLREKFIKSYPFNIEYYMMHNHGGVSAARNFALDKATADYVMFCDADDMFLNACGLYIIFREMKEGFDTLVSSFIEESRHPETKEPIYVTHPQDSTFVHGKVHRRKFLISNNIRWNDNLTIHEDSYFNCLVQQLAKEAKYCPTPFYLWKWRDESVCRHDPKYILKTYNNMLDSNTALVKELEDRGLRDQAHAYIAMMVYDAYYTMNKDEWIDQDNQDYRKAVEDRFRQYYAEFNNQFNALDKETHNQIIMGIKNRMFGEGLFMETITFNDWIKKIQNG